MPDRSPRLHDPLAPVRGRLVQSLQAAWRRDRTARWIAPVSRLLRLDRETGRQVALARLRELLLWAKATTPFWARRMKEAGFDPRSVRTEEDLRVLPRLTRQEIGRHARDLVARPWRGRRLYESTSGGTTSEPVPFVQSPEAVWWKAATTLLLRRKMGWWPGDRVAFLWGAVQDLPEPGDSAFARRRRALVQQGIERTLWLPAGDISIERAAEYAEQLRRFRPQVLQGYPSATDLVARHLLKAERTFPIPVIVLTAETVFPGQRRRIAEAFQAEVYSFYGAREVGWIGDECREEHRLHLNTPGVFLESDDEGRLLVTDLVDRAAPLLRYEIGDRGRLDPDPCPCGDPRPVLGALEGRINEIFVLPSGRRIPSVVVDQRNWQIEDGILEAQLEQTAPDRIVVRWVPASTWREGLLEPFRAFLDEHLYGEVTLDFERVDRILPEANGKVRHCIALPSRKEEDEGSA